MEYLHLIRDETARGKVRRVAQNDSTLTEFYGLVRLDGSDADLLLALGHALIGNTYLCKLILRDLVLTEEAAHALAHGIAQSKITQLALYDDCREHPSSHASSSSSSSQQGRICDIFYRGIQASSTIQLIQLYQYLTDENPGNGWRDALLGLPSIEIKIWYIHGYAQAFSEVLSRTSVLRDLTMVLREVEPDDIAMLAHSLRQNTSLRNLHLVNERIGSQDLRLLFDQGLNPNSSIIKLTAADGMIDDESIELLADRWLPNCPSMRSLFLNSNKIGPTGARRLIQVVDAHPTIWILDLRNNKSIGYAGLRMIGNELPNLQHLPYLYLNGCSTWNDDLEADNEEAKAQTTALQQAGQALLDGIKRNRFITTLNVEENGFPVNVVDEIDFYCALNGTGRHLLSAKEDDHGLPPFGWCHVFVKCQHHHIFGTSLVYFYLKEQPTLVHPRSFLLKRRRSRES